ncbi:MAG: hypothetical protein BWY79_01642 [Actinobacteria bacterium ADurb.Bin444]|nr:MAG: hypothetical protein BWY79_01642 [Actinobacteria bacterium ADurb.Bin444]
MVEHQAGALLVGVIEGHYAIVWVAAIAHIRDGLHADALWVRGVFAGGCNPLVRGTIADPGGDAAVEVQGGAVFGIAVGILDDAVTCEHIVAHTAHGVLRVHLFHAVHVRTHARTHHGSIHRDEEVPINAGWEEVVEFDSHRAILSCHNRGSKVVGRGDAEEAGEAFGPIEQRIGESHVLAGDNSCGNLHIASQQGFRQVGVHFLAVLHHSDFVVIGAGVGGGIGHRHRQILPQVVGIGCGQPGQAIHEFADATGDGSVFAAGCRNSKVGGNRIHHHLLAHGDSEFTGGAEV